MRMRITFVALVLAITGMSLTAVACSSDTTAPEQTAAALPVNHGQQAQSLQDQYAWVGKYHNDALAYALVKMKQSRKVSKYDRCKVGLSALKDFQKAFRKSGGSAAFDDLTITDGMCEAAAENDFAVSRSLSVDRFTPRNDISADANDYMSQIVGSVDVSTTVPGLSFKVAGIVNSAGESLDELESGAVAGTGSIAVSSAEYWEANESSWGDGTQLMYMRSAGMTPPSAPVFSLSTRTKTMIRADVAAAISVLVYEWWTGEVAVSKACIKAAAASLIAGLSLT